MSAASERPDLRQVLADWKSDAAVLARCGQTKEAAILMNRVRAVEAAAEDFLRFLTESEAMLHSGATARWLQSRFGGWERDGHAYKQGRTRYYRMCVVPRRMEGARAFEAGRAAARRSAA